MRRLAAFACLLLFASAWPPSQAPAQLANAKGPQVWAVLIGIDKYRDAAIAGCRGTRRAGAELGRWFAETAVWGTDHVLLLNEIGTERHGRSDDPTRVLAPTRENLDWAIREWAGSRARPGDVVVVYFAGQAAVAGKQEYLLPLDARADNLEETGWSPESAVDSLALLKRCSVLLWLDTSPWGRGKPAVPGEVDPSAGIRLLNRLTRWPSVSAWLAADGQPAPEGTDGSPFLSALLEGLGKRPNNVLACLDRMQQDGTLRHQGFRVRGGVAPDLTLWPSSLLPPHMFKPVLLLQHGHADAVTNIILSSDGEQMVTASNDSTVRIWRIRDRERTLLRVLPNHTVGVTALALSPDGRLLASGDGAGRVRVWDLLEQRERRLAGPPPHSARVVGLVFFPDRQGKRLASLDQDGRSMIWSTDGATLKVQPLLSTPVLRMDGATREGPAALALAGEDASVTLVGADGQVLRPSLEGAGGRASALDLDAAGTRVAVGDVDGKVRVWEVAERVLLYRHDYGGSIGAVRLCSEGRLAVGSEDRLLLAALDKPGPGPGLPGVADDVDALGESSDGRWLAALTRTGDGCLWDLTDRARPVLRPLEMAGRPAGLASLQFARDSRRLVAGEGDGGIRAWDLPSGRERPRIEPHRGKVHGLSVAADGRYLLQIGQDQRALVWDLKEGRGARAVAGRWTAGALVPAGDQVVLIRTEDQGGDVVVVDRATGRTRTTFDRPLARDGRQVSRASFGRLAVSRDGRTVAAITAPGQVEFACVWKLAGGPPRTFRGHTAPLTALDLSADGRFLLTASEDGTVRVWDLNGADDAPPQILGALPGRIITAARFNPTNPRAIVTAQLSRSQVAEIILWEPDAAGVRKPNPLGELFGRVRSLVLTPDARWIGAAGQDGAVHLWTFDAQQRPVRALFELEHQHTEQVNDLIAWPGIPMIASGGDDTTVRLWALDPKQPKVGLVGTLSADPPAVDAPVKPLAMDAQSAASDWVAYTPEGVYDSSLGGDRAVSFVLDREVRPLEQYAETFHRFQLTDDLRKGSSPAPPKHTPPPALVIDPLAVPDLKERDVELTIALADPKLKLENLRLYQNGVPVQEGQDFQPVGQSGRFSAHVRLKSGVNRFYAMAGRPADIDARSGDVEVRFDGPDEPGRIHVIALGVKDYTRNALRFADRDAKQMAEFLHSNGFQTANQPGELVVLTDEQVTERAVEDRFAALRSRVKRHPEDTVVVFLAGHTDVLKDPATGRERFTLLLPAFPFPTDAPLVAMNRGVNIGAATVPKLPPGADLPFYVLYRNLSHLDALQRLVIVDACQAEAIYNDPGVRTIQRVMETDAHKARVSYLLAARRGEPANESSVLEHGLLTYVLLKGMQAPGLRNPDVALPVFDEYPTADDDRDGIVTTRELRLYADRTLPVLAGQLPDLARRSGRVGTGTPSDALPQRPPASDPLRFRAEEVAAFGVATVPKAPQRGGE